MTTISDEIREGQRRVDAGIEWLDENVRPDWPSRVEVLSLNLRDGCRCVLGQVNYLPGDETRWNDNGYCRVIDPDGDDPNKHDQVWAIEHGFDSGWDKRTNTFVSFDVLQDLWAAAITERQENLCPTA